MAATPDERRAGALWLRRVAALAVDWVVALLITTLLPWESPLVPLAVFALEQVLLVGTLGHSLGHRILGLHVQREGGGDAGPVAALIRTVLLVAVLPPLITDENGRGLHDKAAGTQIVRFAERVGRP